MRKFWGWAMLIIFLIMAGIIRYSLIRAGGVTDDNWWKVGILGIIELSLLLSWYRLAIRKTHKEEHEKEHNA